MQEGKIPNYIAIEGPIGVGKTSLSRKIAMDFGHELCLEESDDLICVCGCKGTAQYVHKECIEQWINRFPVNHPNHNKCQICNQNYNFDLIGEVRFNHCYERNVLTFIYIFFIIIGIVIVIVFISML